jgi:hypothetical protein
MDEWIHPFLNVSTDYVADSIDDAARWVADYIQSPATYSIKDLSVFDEAISLFERSQPTK